MRSGTRRLAREVARRRWQDGAEKLRGWFNDWGTTLRQVIGNNNHLLLLGLVVPSRGGVVAEELEGEEETDGAVSPAAPNVPVIPAPLPVNA